MSDLFWPTDAQIARFAFFPKLDGKPSVDDRLVLHGIIFITAMG